MSPTANTAARPFREELHAMAAGGQVRTFQAGETVFAAGAPGDGLYVVNSGTVRISAVVGQNEPRVLARLGPGDYFGEMAVLDDAPRSASAIADTDCRLTFISREHFLQLLEQRPELAVTFSREFSVRMRAANKRHLEEIVQAERLAAIGRFAGTIVHDFKNPLTVIGLAAEIGCADATLPAARQNAQKRIVQQVERMTNMLQELIEFTKPSGARPNLHATNFATFMSALSEEIAQEIASRNVELVVQMPPPAVTVQIDAQRLTRLFYNLVNNAVDEMRTGGKIFLRFTATPTELTVSLEDTGKGIAPEIARTLFQPFATHGKAHGTGLGLSICKKIAEDHAGRIWVDSPPGKGAIFHFTLPLRS